MLKLPIIELFLRTIPEGFLFMLASYALSRQAVDKKKYIISSILLGTIGYLVRLLPINFGVHSIINIIVFIALTVSINKINLIKAMSSAIISVILMFISEMINIFIIQNVLKLDIAHVFSQPILKSTLGLPSLLIPLCVVGIYYYALLKRKKLR